MYGSVKRVIGHPERKLVGIKDDPMDEAERFVREQLTDQAKSLLNYLAERLTVENAPRCLMLVQQTAECQRDLLALVQLEGESGELRRALPGQYGYLGAPMDDETYGANALEQMASSMSRAVGPTVESRLRDVMTALERAVDSGESALATSLRARADKLLKLSESTSGTPEPSEEVEEGEESS